MEREAALLPPLPVAPPPPSDFSGLWTKISSAEFGRLADEHPLVVWERETRQKRDIVREMECARRDELHKRCGYDAAHRVWENILHKEMWPIARKIWATPAHTAEGMMVKLTAASLVGVRDPKLEPEEDYVKSIGRDIRRLGKSPTGRQMLGQLEVRP